MNPILKDTTIYLGEIEKPMKKSTAYLNRKGFGDGSNHDIIIKRDNVNYNVTDFLDEFHKEQSIIFKVKKFIHSKVQELADKLNQD